MNRPRSRFAPLLLAGLLLAGCSSDGDATRTSDDDPPSPLLPADPSANPGPSVLAPSTTQPQITAPTVDSAEASCPEGKLRWVTERTTIEDERQGDPHVWRVNVVGRIENRTTERVVTGVQDLEIMIYRPPAWDGVTPYYASAPPDDDQLAPGAKTAWRVSVTLQSESRPRVGSVRAAPTWADERISRICPQPSGEGAKPRPNL